MIQTCLKRLWSVRGLCAMLAVAGIGLADVRSDVDDDCDVDAGDFDAFVACLLGPDVLPEDQLCTLAWIDDDSDTDMADLARLQRCFNGTDVYVLQSCDGACSGPNCDCLCAQTNCGGVCTWLNDNLNCGMCGNACAAGFDCINGECVDTTSCPGQALCGGACVDLSSDVLNCGGCGDACLPGQQCDAGICVGDPDCPEGLIRCDGICIDPITDPANCGDCGNVCPNQCVAGACQ